MGANCLKTQSLHQYSSAQIDFHALFKKDLVGPTGNFFQLLNFLTERDVGCLTYLVKALFHRSLNEKIFKFVLSFSNQIDYFQPPSRLVKLAQQKGSKNGKRDSIKKQIMVKASPYNNLEVQKDVDEVFSRSSCPFQNLKEDYYQKQYYIENNEDLRNKQRQIEEKLEKLSQALRGAQKAYEIERSCNDGRQQSRFQEIQSQGPSSFISKESRKSPPNRIMGSIKYGNEKMFATSFHSGSPRHQTSTKIASNQGIINLKKMQTLKQSKNNQSDNIELRSNYSKRSNRYQETIEGVQLADKYLEIKQFYEGQIARYKAEMEYLKNRLVITEKDKQSSSGISSNIFGSLLSKQSKESIVDSRKRAETMKLCSAQVSQQINEGIPEVREYGTIMSSVQQSDDSSQDKDSQSNDSSRKHANSMIIRLFRDSKMFPIEYSKKTSPIRFVQIREKIQSIFKSFYTQEIYQKNPIQQTNMILCFEDRLPKRYCDYLKDYKSWMLIGKVNQDLYIGAYINLKQGPKTSTKECFLFSMSTQGKPYILSAKNYIKDPIIRPQHINFGDSQFRIKTGTKTVSLSLQNMSMSFQEFDGNQPNTRRFSLKYGESVQLQELEFHQIVFSGGNK